MAPLRTYYRLLVPLGLGLLALMVPLLRDFHIESALLAAIAGCFWAGWKAIGSTQNRKRDFADTFSILGYIYLFGSPLLIYALLTGCFSMHGLGFWLLFPIPSIFFGYAVGRLIRIWSIPFGQIVVITLLLLIAIGVWIAEFYTFPQVYFYNHVWGGWPGPIYDETVQITGSLIYFRFLTLLWTLLLWFIPDFTSGKEAKWIVVLSVIALLFSYTQMSEFGIISPREHIQKQLGGVKEAEHFRLYYADDYYTEDEIDLLALEHEFYLDEISRKLEIAKPNSAHKIESYLYANPWQKKNLVGAKFTSYVPVWLDQDQLHIAKQQISGSLKHELVHVLAKQFGNKLINASWSIGLIEGLAVAVSPDESVDTTIDQIVKSETPLSDAEAMQQALSPMGFYSGRSAVNYTTSGSFVRYLLKKYPVPTFKEAYKKGSIEDAYSVSFEELVEGWHNHLNTVTVDSLDREIARRLFSVPSLFEKKCPHILSDFAEHWDNYRYYLAIEDTSQAIHNLDQAYQQEKGNPFIKSEWAYMNLMGGNIEKVQNQASFKDPTIDLQLLYADAFMLSGDKAKAETFLNQGEELLKNDPDSASKIALETRSDFTQWTFYRNLTYHNKLIKSSEFGQLLYRTKIRTIEKTIKDEQWGRFRMYSQILSESDVDTKYFDTYMSMVHMLGYLHEWNQAENWLMKLKVMDLRERYKERLHQQRRWIRYLKDRESQSR